jgi:hypothetical protein
VSFPSLLLAWTDQAKSKKVTGQTDRAKSLLGHFKTGSFELKTTFRALHKLIKVTGQK